MQCNAMHWQIVTAFQCCRRCVSMTVNAEAWSWTGIYPTTTHNSHVTLNILCLSGFYVTIITLFAFWWHSGSVCYKIQIWHIGLGDDHNLTNSNQILQTTTTTKDDETLSTRHLTLHRAIMMKRLNQDDGTWTDIPRCIEHEPGVEEQIPGLCPGVSGYCATGFLNGRCRCWKVPKSTKKL